MSRRPGKPLRAVPQPLTSFPDVAFETPNPNIDLIDDSSFPSSKGGSSSAGSPPPHPPPLHLSPPSNRWCNVLGFVPAGSVSNSSTLQIFREAGQLY